MISSRLVLLSTVIASIPQSVSAEPGDTELVSVGYATGRAVGGEASQLWDFVSHDGRYAPLPMRLFQGTLTQVPTYLCATGSTAGHNA